MPEDSKVHRMYESLLKEGHSKESAARIAQSETGDALATGKPAKHENSQSYQNGRNKALSYLASKGLSVAEDVVGGAAKLIAE